MQCGYYDSGRCRSCTLLEQPYAEQLAGKVAHVRSLLPADVAWLEPVASAQEGFRNKAKMVVAGTVEAPTLGILDPAGHGVDLRDCPLHEPGLHAALPALAAFVTRAAVAPYDVPTQAGRAQAPAGDRVARR